MKKLKRQKPKKAVLSPSQPVPQSHFFDFFTSMNCYLQQNPDKGLHLWFADEEAFSCSQCGQCCFLPWKAHVSRTYYEAWGDKLADTFGCQKSDLFEITQPDSESMYAVMAKQAGSDRCIMLDDSQKCRIHNLFGAEAKPLTCRTYPRMDLRLEKQHYSASFMMQSCFSVARQAPQPWTLQCRFLTVDPNSVQPQWPLVQGRFLDRWAFHLWQGHLLDQLELKPDPVFWLAQTTESLSQFLKLGRSLYSAEDIQLSRSLAAASPRAMNGTEQQAVLGLMISKLESHQYFQELVSWLKAWQAGALSPTPLSAAEYELMVQHHKQYFQRAVIMQTYLQTGLLNMVQQHYVWGIFAVSLQLLSLFYRERGQTALNLQDLGKAMNMMHAMLAQNPYNVRQASFHELPPELCLVQLVQLGRWSLKPQPQRA